MRYISGYNWGIKMTYITYLQGDTEFRVRNIRYKAKKEWSKALEYAKAALHKAEAHAEYFGQELIDDLREDVDSILEQISSPQEHSR